MTYVATSSRMDSAETIAAALRVIDTTRSHGGDAHVLGGIGIALRCPSAQPGGPLARTYSDMDLVTTKHGSPTLAHVLHDLGYVPAERFNAVHGKTRLMFDDPQGLHADVFVEQFQMCHQLDFKGRLGQAEMTVSLADLLLTKLQVAELNEKDVSDTAALFLDHELGQGGEEIDVAFVTKVLSTDWGWWRTVSENLLAIPEHLSVLPLTEDEVSRVNQRANGLVTIVQRAPKSLPWRLRARAGDRVAWREEPEESR